MTPQLLDVLLVQFAILYRGGERMQMSTRSGEFVTLRELRHEVGNDAARFFYVLRKCEQHLDFDLDLAKSQSTDNPVYYIQYAHARIAACCASCGSAACAGTGAMALGASRPLGGAPRAGAASNSLARYPEVIEAAAPQLRAAPARPLPARTGQ